ncbi:MAG: hypothetical protein PHP02_01330 [Eubacteriales bacterium]|nr:hypothetical protein [Eubacteriales bacterium]
MRKPEGHIVKRHQTIGEGAFRGLSSLETLNIAQSAVQSPHSIYWWIGRSDAKGVNIPDGVSGIGVNALEGRESITSVIIPCSENPMEALRG